MKHHIENHIAWIRCTATLIVITGLIAGCGGNSSPLAPSGMTGVIHVDPNGQGEFALIQDAINAAAPGAIVEIGPGEFHELLVLDKNITLRGTGSGPIIKAPSSSSGALLLIRGENGRVVENMTFSGGDSEGIIVRNSRNVILRNVVASHNGGHGIDIRESSHVDIINCGFDGNGHNGLRIRDRSFLVVIDSCSMNGNRDNGIRIREGEDIAIENSDLSNNTENGIRLRDVFGVTFNDNSITNNGEWGMRKRNADIAESGNTFSGNVNGDVRVDKD